jgi:hypothetical protein
MTAPADSPTTAAAPRSRRPFFAILGLFFLPLAVAFLMYYGSSWRPSGTTNKGDLIAPAVPLPLVTLETATGQRTSDSFLREDWTLVFVGDGACADLCRAALIDLRLAHQMLGKDMGRIKRVFLYTGAPTEQAYLAKEHPDLTSASLDTTQGQSLLAKFPSVNGVPAAQAGRTYIVDPLGNLMMSYAPGTDARSIYQDMKKLLNLSHIG